MCGKTRQAFTLIEVLVVVAIIALLISILLPSLNAAREQSRVLVCKTRLVEMFKGHNFYAQDHKNYFPEYDWWLWDGINGNMTGWFPGLYKRVGGTRPNDSSRWVEFGHIYKYIKSKEAYFCPKDTMERTEGSIGSGMTYDGVYRGNKPIHSYVRFREPHAYTEEHNNRGGGNPPPDLIPNSPLNDLQRSHFINPDKLKPGAFDPRKINNKPLNSIPNRIGLLYEEYQNFGEPPAWIGPNKRHTLNDGYSGFLVNDDFLSLRHRLKSNVLFWDGHTALVDALRFNKERATFGAYTAVGAARY